MGLPWLPNSDGRVTREMLEAVGVSDVSELFGDIPDEVRLKRPLRVGAGRPLSEAEVYRLLTDKADRVSSCLEMLCFAAGLAPHYVPAVVLEIVGRSEFYTSYTPYQAEVSQGMLQALFEYQSLMADLLEMDVVNASMYDGSTALAEAFLMAARVTRRRKILVPEFANPCYLKVAETIVKAQGLELVTVENGADSGLLDIGDLKRKLDDDAAAVYVEVPYFYGPIEEQVDEISSLCHSHGALLVAGVDPLSLGLIRPPGDYGADIAVGEGQPLGLGLNYGGPLLGFFGVRGERRLVRQLPGRLIGMTTSMRGERGFAMILQTREQHIRRERATSNICTNQALCALAAAVYLSLLGSSGLRELSRTIAVRARYAASQINRIEGFRAPAVGRYFFKSFAVRSELLSAEEVRRKLLAKDILVGPVVTRLPKLGESFMVAVTEIHSRADIDRLVEALEEVVGDV